jgi:hypothetical protein
VLEFHTRGQHKSVLGEEARQHFPHTEFYLGPQRQSAQKNRDPNHHISSGNLSQPIRVSLCRKETTITSVTKTISFSLTWKLICALSVSLRGKIGASFTEFFMMMMMIDIYGPISL